MIHRHARLFQRLEYEFFVTVRNLFRHFFFVNVLSSKFKITSDSTHEPLLNEFRKQKSGNEADRETCLTSPDLRIRPAP